MVHTVTACSMVWNVSQAKMIAARASLTRTQLVRSFSNNIKQFNKKSNQHFARLLISGPNASGIVASFSQLLYKHSCDIVDFASESSSVDDFDNHNDHKMFFQRILFDHTHLGHGRDFVEDEIIGMCQQFGMNYRLVRLIFRFYR